MNKTLIILLATCLLSVHAFVKRDAPAATTENAISAQFETIKKQAGEFFGNAQTGFKENFEKVQKIAIDAFEKIKEVSATEKKEQNTPA